MDVIVLANSTGFYVSGGEPYHFRNSYIHRLSEKYNVSGHWSPGLMVLHFRKMIKAMVKYYRPVVIQVGCCEAVTRPAKDFLQLSINYMCHYLPDSFFDSIIVSKMEKAIDDICKGKETYYCFLSPEEFRNLYVLGCRALMGRQGILMGLVRPKIEDQRKIDQLGEYNNIIKEVAEYTDNYFIDVWNLTDAYSGDTTHITFEGHKIIFEKIQEKINECFG